jgi:hypothetical protein
MENDISSVKMRGKLSELRVQVSTGTSVQIDVGSCSLRKTAECPRGTLIVNMTESDVAYSGLVVTSYCVNQGCFHGCQST